MMRVVVRPRPSGAQHTSHGLFWGNAPDSMRLFAGLLTSVARHELQALSRHNLRDHSPDSLSLCLLLAVCRRIGQCLSKQQQCLEQSTAGADVLTAFWPSSPVFFSPVRGLDTHWFVLCSRESFSVTSWLSRHSSSSSAKARSALSPYGTTAGCRRIVLRAFEQSLRTSLGPTRSVPKHS